MKKEKLHITYIMSGKMENMHSLSTSPILNPMCNIRCTIKGSVCEKCFSKRQFKRYKNQECFDINTKLLTAQILDMPKINSKYFRFEAFGDIINTIQVLNYFNMCYKNKETKFALWTKNPTIIKNAIDEFKIIKPKNLQIIGSSFFINKIMYTLFDYQFIDKVFTVYTKEYIKDNNIEINCDNKKCYDCKKCYNKNNIKFINERLK